MGRNISYHREQAELCRAVAAGCLHRATADSLRELAAEHEAKAERLEADEAEFRRWRPKSRMVDQMAGAEFHGSRAASRPVVARAG
jgi:hypothetical protein